VDVANTTNAFQSRDQQTNTLSTTLDCVASGSDILVYGITENIDVSEVGGTSNNLDLKLKVSSFTAPGGVFTAFTWNVEVLRAKTYNILKKYQGTNKPDLAAGAITVSSWVSTNGYPTTYMKQSIPVYMTTIITTQTAIPAAGKIEVDFSDTIETSGSDQCYIVHQYASCTANTKKVTITFSGTPNNDDVAAGSFTFYTLNSFDTSSPTASITAAVSYTASSGVKID
jgi:hypothetical protein